MLMLDLYRSTIFNLRFTLTWLTLMLYYKGETITLDYFIKYVNNKYNYFYSSDIIMEVYNNYFKEVYKL